MTVLGRAPRFGTSILAFLTLTGCAHDQPASDDTVVERDSAGVRIVMSSAPSAGSTGWRLDSVPSVQIGTGEGDERYQLFRVLSALTLGDGRIVISNSGTHEVRVFSPDGEFLYAFGRNGQGPGEFGDFSSMRVYPIDGDSIAVTDGANGRLNVFSTNGGFGRTVALTSSDRFGRPGVFGRFDGGGWLALAAVGSGALQGAPGERIDMDHAYLEFRTEDEPQILSVVAARPRVVNELGGITHYPYVPLTPSPSVATDGQTILLAEGAAAEVRRIDRSGEVTEIYRWSVPVRPVGEIWDRFQREYLADIEDVNRRRLYARFLERDLPIPESVPAVESLAVDELGNIWVERHRLPWESDAEWDVLSPAGHWRATVTIPKEMDVMHIGEHELLVRDADELGIERVSLVALHRDTSAHRE